MKSEQIKYFAACALILSAGAALRIVFAINAFYDPEEIIRVREVHAPTFSTFISEISAEMTPFLDAFFLRALFQISNSELFVRICYSMLGIVYLGLLCLLVGKMLNDRWLGAFVAALAALSPLLVFYSGIVRYHNFHAIFCLFSVYFFWHTFYKMGGMTRAATYGFFTALALMTHYYTFYLIAAQIVVFLFFSARHLKAWKNIAVASAAGAATFIPYFRFFIFQIDRADSSALSTSVIANEFFSRKIFNHIDSILNMILGEHYLIHSRLPIERILLFSVFSFLLVFFLLLIFHMVKEHNNTTLTFPVIMLSVTLTVAFATSEVAGGMPVSAKFLMPFTFLFFMILVLILSRVNNYLTRAALSTALLAIMLLSQVNLFICVFEKPNVRTTATHICNDIKDGGVVVFSAEAVAIPGYGEIDYTHEMALEYFAEYAPCSADVALVDDGRFAGHTRLRPGKLNVVKLISAGDTESVEKLLQEHGRLWLFYFNLGREPYEHLRREILPTEAYRTLAKIAPPAESIIFKVSPRRDYFSGGAFLFLKQPDI